MGTKRDLDAFEAKRLRGLELFRQGVRPAEIARRSGVSRQAVSQWLQAYRRGGLSALARIPHQGRPPRLNSTQQGQLEAMLLCGATAHGYVNDLWTSRRVAKLIRDNFTVTFHHKHIPRLLRGLGWSCQKPTGKAAERDETAIARWIARDWPRIKKKPAGKRRPSSS
jgi:transposase